MKAVKNGWMKAAAIKDAVNGFTDKTVDDESGIDYDSLKIDESTVQVKVLFMGQQGQTLREFAKNCLEGLTGNAEEDAKDDPEEDLDGDPEEGADDKINESERISEASGIAELMDNVKVDGNHISGFSASAVVSRATKELGINTKKLA